MVWMGLIICCDTKPGFLNRFENNGEESSSSQIALQLNAAITRNRDYAVQSSSQKRLQSNEGQQKYIQANGLKFYRNEVGTCTYHRPKKLKGSIKF